MFFPRLYRQRQPCPITLGVLPLRRWGTALANWGGALGFSSAFLLISGNLRKTKCFVFPLLGRKKDGRCLEERWRDNSGLAESLGTELGLPGKKRCQELTGLARQAGKLQGSRLPRAPLAHLMWVLGICNQVLSLHPPRTHDYNFYKGLSRECPPPG